MRLLILSDVHWASDAEQVRRGHEGKVIRNPLLRTLARAYRHYIWLRDPFGWNHLLDHILRACPNPDLVVANGDFNADTAFIGVCDDLSFTSATECLKKLRSAYTGRFHATIGDHELGKMSLFGGAGGPRLRSLERTVGDLGIQAFWKLDTGRHVILGVASTLLALPLFHPEIVATERTAWDHAQAEQMASVRKAFDGLRENQRVLLFCHDPSALPFLYREPSIRRRLPQIEATIIGHLHTRLVFDSSRFLAGMPVLRRAGNTARRLSTALNEARCWKEFKVRLCPSPAGCELLKDGGYLTAELPAGDAPVTFQFHPIPR